MLVVATDDFEVYHGVVGELRDRGVTFTTVEPDASLPEGPDAVLTAADEREGIEANCPVVVVKPDEPRRAVEEALAMLRGDGGRTVIGVDPGENPGIAVLADETVVAAFQAPTTRAADIVTRELEDAVDPIVRVGDGARIQGSRIIDAIDDARVELVDETGTTPYLGTGARGMGDVLAAVNIARIEGEPIDSRSVEPTPGEIQVIKSRSRERSAENREIGTELSRRVARGELTVEEALAEHAAERNGTEDEAEANGNGTEGADGTADDATEPN